MTIRISLNVSAAPSYYGVTSTTIVSGNRGKTPLVMPLTSQWEI